ncbi:MAG: RsmE family RNA methyltransferase [Bacteroidota bacterium]
MEPGSLSDIELYFSPKVSEQQILVEGEECHHIKDVMRHENGDEIFVTNGLGSIYRTKIESIDSKKISCKIIEEKNYPNQYSNFTFCIPRLRTADRFEFALEKCVELGITNFIVFDSQRTVAKGEKLDRWQKILISAMKQSLRAWLPSISYYKSIADLLKLNGEKIFLDQNANKSLKSILNSQLSTLNYFFIFGPEGGFSKEELRIMPIGRQVAHGELRVKLTDNRLRSETAIVTAAALLVNSLNN